MWGSYAHLGVSFCVNINCRSPERMLETAIVCHTQRSHGWRFWPPPAYFSEWPHCFLFPQKHLSDQVSAGPYRDQQLWFPRST